MSNLELGVRLLLFAIVGTVLLASLAGLIVAVMPPGDDPYENIPADPTTESEN